MFQLNLSYPAQVCMYIAIMSIFTVDQYLMPVIEFMLLCNSIPCVLTIAYVCYTKCFRPQEEHPIEIENEVELQDLQNDINEPEALDNEINVSGDLLFPDLEIQ